MCKIAFEGALTLDSAFVPYYAVNNAAIGHLFNIVHMNKKGSLL
jgi:hypothetical protein